MSNEIWQVEVNKQIYEANTEELCQWIIEGALLPADKVRRGNLRWLEANKVPVLYGFFNAKERGLPFPVLQTVTDAASGETNPATETENLAMAQMFNETESDLPAAETHASFAPNAGAPADANACHFHAEEAAKYVCETCANFFCKACPKAYGANVRICPLCGAMCKALADVQARQQRNFQYQTAFAEGFGFEDFGRALAYPFRFKTSLIFGAVMFMLFTLGQSAASMGSFFLVAASIFCAMLANTLTFGCLANTIENFSQGRTDENFMPRFDDFELWDDVIHPFFLSIATYLVSFAPLVLIIVVSMFYLIGSMKTPGNPIENAPAQLQQKNVVIEQMNRQAAERNRQIGDAMNGTPKAVGNGEKEEEEIRRVEEMIQQSRKSQLESAVGKSPETVKQENEALVKQFLGKGALVLLLSFLALLWGAFYFPAACAVAGYTRSFTAVLNPSIGIDTIKRLGADYLKILAMCFVLGVFSFGASFVLAIVFSPFDLPRMGNLPATAVGSLFTFYFSIVFSVTLGYALYKNSAKLNLFHE